MKTDQSHIPRRSFLGLLLASPLALAASPTPPRIPISPANLELRLLFGGSLEEIIIEAFTRDLQNHLRETRVTYDRCETLAPFLAKAQAAPYDLFFLYLYFGGQPGCSIEIPNASPSEFLETPNEIRTGPAYVTWGGLKLVTYLKTHFPTPIVVLTSTGKAPELAALASQAGADYFLPVPFRPEEFRKVVATCADHA